MSVTSSDRTGLPSASHGIDLPAAGAIDVETLRGRRAVNRWERTSLGDVFERLTWSYPDQVALEGRPGGYGEERFAALTYRQADEAANRLANALAAAGLEPGDRVLLICENSVEAYVAKIGIAKAGMVAVPLNPSLAPDVLEHLIRLTEPRFTLVDAELWPRAEAAFAATGLTVGATITIGGGPLAGSPGFGELLDAQSAAEPDVEIHGDDICQLLFTSGTTAMPKGVMLSHSYAHLAGMNFALSLSRGLRHEADLRLVTFLPLIYHVGDVLFPLGAMLAGGTVVLGRRPVPGPVAEAIAETRATAIWAGSPQFVAALGAELENRPELDVSSLTTLVYGWGALAPGLLEKLDARAGRELVTLGIFGQTEAIACHRFWPTRWPEVHRRSAPAVNYVGVPSPLLASDVVDELGEPVRGEPGEAVYRSPIMTAGYYRNPEATAEVSTHGWHHTGDIGFLDADGFLYIVDRAKDMVITGGFNVYSAEVEQALMAHAAVRDCAVIGLPDEKWGERVTAVIQPQPGAEIDPDELIAFVKDRIGSVKAPKQIEIWADLPRSTIGKVLKKEIRVTLTGGSTA